MNAESLRPADPKGLAISSIIVGAVSVLLSWPFWILGAGIIGGVVSLVLAIVARRRGQSKRMALIGMIVGLLAMLSGIIALAYFLSIINSALNDPAFQQQLQELEDQSKKN
ncbi:hypothetical protein G7066_04920 [Leucobacter coleopterorum]|uniref:DUF4190 domain-containing protein n=1 Tax=Leucobacter coleopterorum TaxID=2714933 RepID=A0ABX6JW05_9MICO|nr:hypothetical protein [Leucobacter coleopterorum]QIM18166.1 hypothetical protein G7066_04920 [Leucobacter coleopterorum]